MIDSIDRNRANRARGATALMTLALFCGPATSRMFAQQPVWTQPAPLSTPVSPSPPSAPVAPQRAVPAAASTQGAAAAPAETASGGPPPSKYYKPVPGKKNKFDYVGPKEVVELPPTPMLDPEGRQRLDPEGKPMFNPPVRQQRDKHGNPLFDEHGQPVLQTASDLGFDDKGKKIHGKKEKPVKTVSMTVERGTLTVDGMTGKAGLNYEIRNLRYLYLYAPWIGVTIVSPTPFPGSIEQKNAFNDTTLTVTVEDHTLQLYSDKRLLGKKPESAFVAIDRSFKSPSTFPVVGYGETPKAPYAWPGSKENAVLKGSVAPPPLPPSIRPVTLLQPCPAGQMRRQAGTPIAGQIAAPSPCVPIVDALHGSSAPTAAPAMSPAQR